MSGAEARDLVYARARRIFLAAAWAKPPAALVEEARRAPPEAWEEAAAAALRTHEEPLFHHFVTRFVPEAPLSLPARRELEAQFRFHAFRWEEIRECLEAVGEALAEKGIEPLLLKGIASVGDCYDLPRLRPMRDLDLLIRPERVEEAQALLRAWGFAPRADAEAADYGAHHHLEPLFHPVTGICVELHRHPLGRRAVLPGVPPLEELWGSARRSPAAGSLVSLSGLLVLEPTMHLLVTCLHFTLADHIADRVSQLIDLARMIEVRGGEMDWERLLAQAAERRLARALAVPLLYLARAGLPSAPEEARARLVRKARLRGWERDLFAALIERYRLGGLPPPWRWLSGRSADIVWGEMMRGGSLFARAIGALRQSRERRKRARAKGRGKALGAAVGAAAGRR